MILRKLLIALSLLLVVSGCVMVNPGEVRVGSPPASVVVGPEPSTAQSTYGGTLQRVIRQQDKVVKEFRRGNWSEVIDEAGEWTEYVRVLSGYAGSTHDPARFSHYCDQLLIQVQAIRDAGVHEDSARCQVAIRACDPILNALSREFPVAGAAPPRAPAPASSTPPAARRPAGVP